MLENFARIGAAIKSLAQSREEQIESYMEQPKTIIEVRGKKGAAPQKVEVHPVVFDFDLKNKKVSIKKGEQFSERKKYNISSFKGNSKKGTVYLNTTKPSLIFFGKVIEGLEEWLREESGTEPQKFNKVKEYVEKIKNFYEYAGSEIKGISLQTIDPPINELESLYNKILNYEQKKKEQEFDKGINEIFGSPSAKGKDIRYCLTYFNGKPIDQHSEFFKEYLELLYKEKIGKSFDKGELKTNKVCHICGKEKDVTGKINIPSKFYITDKPGFFENMETENAYKSLSSCIECYENTKSGVKWIDSNLNFNYLGMKFYAIPKSQQYLKNLSANIEILKRNVNGLFQNFNENEVADLLSHLDNEKVYGGAMFDFLFYIKTNSAFKIYKHYTDISQLQLRKMLEGVKEVRNRKPLYKGDFSFYTLKDLFYSHKSYKWGKNYPVLIRNIFEILDAIMYESKINKRWFFQLVMQNMKKEFLNDKTKKFAVMNKTAQALMFIDLFRRSIVWGEDMENDFGKTGNGDLDHFLEQNRISGFKKVMVTFGYLINKVISAQKGKSKTFMGKIRFEGMRKQHLVRLHNALLDYFTIYNKEIYRDNNLELFIERGIHAYENQLSPEEVSFYILVGVNAGKAIGISHSKEKKKSEEDN